MPKTLSCANCQHYKSETWGDDWNEPRETEESCEKRQWAFEEPSPSPVTTCKLFDFAVPDEPIDFDAVLDIEEF